MLFYLFFLILAIVIYFKIKSKLYFIKIDHTLMLSGAPGTGKTNEMVKLGLSLWKYNRKKIRRKNFIRKLFKKDLYEEPLLYSNIPVRIGKHSKKEFATLKEKLKDLGYTQEELDNLKRDKFCAELEIDHLLLIKRQTQGAVTLVTEIGKIAHRYDFGNLNIQENVDEYASMYRQYTKGGYFLCDDQSSDNAEVDIRRRIGTLLNMLHFSTFWKFYWVKMRNMTISEDVKTIEEKSTEDNMRTRFGMFPLFHKNYDTYAFSERYSTVPQGATYYYTKYKTNHMLILPKAYYDRNKKIVGINVIPKTNNK